MSPGCRWPLPYHRSRRKRRRHWRSAGPATTKGRHKFVALAYAWRVQVAHGHLLRSRWLAQSFECTLRSASGWLQVACLVAGLDAIAPRHPSRIATPKAPWTLGR